MHDRQQWSKQHCFWIFSAPPISVRDMSENKLITSVTMPTAPSTPAQELSVVLQNQNRELCAQRCGSQSPHLRRLILQRFFLHYLSINLDSIASFDTPPPSCCQSSLAYKIPNNNLLLVPPPLRQSQHLCRNPLHSQVGPLPVQLAAFSLTKTTRWCLLNGSCAAPGRSSLAAEAKTSAAAKTSTADTKAKTSAATGTTEPASEGARACCTRCTRCYLHPPTPRFPASQCAIQICCRPRRRSSAGGGAPHFKFFNQVWCISEQRLHGDKGLVPALLAFLEFSCSLHENVIPVFLWQSLPHAVFKVIRHGAKCCLQKRGPC